MIDASTRTEIKGYLEGFIQGMIDQAVPSAFDPDKLRPLREESKTGELKPFHESLLPDGLLRISEFERSLSTKLGTTFEESARLIAKASHKQAERQHRITGIVAPPAVKRIEEITNDVGSGGMKKSFVDYVDEIVKLSKTDGGEERTSIADLYIETHDGREYFFEIKSPKPNKGQCLEATARLLQIHAITHNKPPKVNVYFASAYNPYGIRKSDYKHSFCINYMDANNEVLIGDEFWTLVGGEGTYEELLAIYQEVGKTKGPEMLDKLALGY